MSRPRFFVDPVNANDYQVAGTVDVVLDADTLHHATKVLRLREGEHIEIVLRDLWRTYHAQIVSLSSEGVCGRILEELTVESPSLEFDLYWGLAKAAKNDQIVRQAVEIGANGLIPVLFSRCDADRKRPLSSSRMQRLRAIALSAAMQSHRSRIPHLADPLPFDEALPRLQSYEGVIVAWEEHEGGSFADSVDGVIASLHGPLADRLESRPLGRLAVVVGGEGGLTGAEVDALTSAGAVIASMGPTILRVETATTVACALVADRIRSSEARISAQG